MSYGAVTRIEDRRSQLGALGRRNAGRGVQVDGERSDHSPRCLSADSKGTHRGELQRGGSTLASGILGAHRPTLLPSGFLTMTAAAATTASLSSLSRISSGLRRREDGIREADSRETRKLGSTAVAPGGSLRRQGLLTRAKQCGGKDSSLRPTDYEFDPAPPEPGRIESRRQLTSDFSARRSPALRNFAVRRGPMRDTSPAQTPNIVSPSCYTFPQNELVRREPPSALVYRVSGFSGDVHPRTREGVTREHPAAHRPSHSCGSHSSPPSSSG
jgi:hypothetical protein